jgi:Helix-turn-helix domain
MPRLADPLAQDGFTFRECHPMTKVRTQTIPVPILLPPQHAADLIGFERSTLRKLLKAGKIKAKVRDGRRYFLTHSLLAYVESLPDA